MLQKQETLKPTASTKRIALLDIFRGFALFGVFVVNIRYMSSSVNHPEAFEWMKEGMWNHSMDWILTLFFNSKFFPIFSFLFGVGFGMQINKMEEKNKFNATFFLKRYSILLLFGVLHILLIWGGDVLLLYSLAGFLVLILRRIPVKYIVILAFLILLNPFYGHLYGYMKNLVIVFPEHSSYTYQDIIAINTQGSFIEALKFRIYEYSIYFRNVEYFPTLIALIFLGYAAGKEKFYSKIPATLKKMTPAAITLIPVLVLFRIYYYSMDGLPENNYKIYVLLIKMNILANIAQSFLYLYFISFLYEKRILTKLIEPLAYAGRTSLTNYIVQSVVGLLLFNGMFFGLYGKFGLAWLGVFALTIYILFIVGSKYWLSKFRYGPLEFIWRELTYKVSLKFIRNGNNQNE